MFQWLENTDQFNVMSISECNSRGYFLKVDLKHPDELHELHNDYPLAPENLLFLLKCCQNILEKLLINIK